MKDIRIYNTLSREKEPLRVAEGGKLQLFVCGPTVYDYAHIGHARTYIFFDFFVKYLRSQGYDVFYLQNITDVDDKIIKRASEEGKSPEELAKFFTKAYLADMRSLGVDSVTKYALATKFIKEIIKQVQRLIDKGFAYKIEGDGWYFDIKKFPDYGKLSGRSASQAEDAVSRIDEAIDKRNKGDFCLWKFSKPGEPTWKSELGDGRPGWHIEDTAISENYFGPQYDIHGGGVDLKFPHHEAEIAQQESASGKKPFVKFWMHTGALLVDGKKMSKSLGNFITIGDFLKKHRPEVLRWIIFGYHYRSPVNYSEGVVRDAESSLDKISEFLAKLEFVSKLNGEDGASLNMKEALAKSAEETKKALADDFATPFVIAQIFGLGLEYQEKIWNMRGSEAKLLKNYIEGTLAVFDILLESPKIPAEVQKLADEREEFRASKQFVQSDDLRKKIDGLGYVIEDTPQGPFLWPKNQL